MARERNTQPTTADTPLTPSEAVFVREYLIDLNGTRHYQIAFPTVSVRSARVPAVSKG